MSSGTERTEWRYSCLIVSSLLFAAMALFMVLGVTDNLDAVTRAGINRWASPNLTAVAEGASFIGSVAVLFSLTALVAAGLWVAGRPRAALMLMLVMGIAGIVNNAIKLTFARARPEAFFGTLPDSYSFASGHALFSACFFSVVAGLIEGKLTSWWQRALVWVLAFSIIAGVGLSRVYLGVHYLTDVIAGLALAALIICLVRSVIAEQR
ncbi:MAG: phosphatase PAP2 family protein [Hyphomicrobium sp.]|nr:phosphatase PAP2 family protein [Hyphomicrobium sp.]